MDIETIHTMIPDTWSHFQADMWSIFRELGYWYRG